MVAVARQLGKILPADLMSRVCVTQRGNVEKLKKHGLLKRQCTTWKLHRKRSHPELVHKDSFQGACVCVCVCVWDKQCVTLEKLAYCDMHVIAFSRWRKMTREKKKLDNRLENMWAPSFARFLRLVTICRHQMALQCGVPLAGWEGQEEAPRKAKWGNVKTWALLRARNKQASHSSREELKNSGWQNVVKMHVIRALVMRVMPKRLKSISFTSRSGGAPFISGQQPVARRGDVWVKECGWWVVDLWTAHVLVGWVPRSCTNRESHFRPPWTFTVLGGALSFWELETVVVHFFLAAHMLLPDYILQWLRIFTNSFTIFSVFDIV